MPASVAGEPPHVPAHVVPAAHACDCLPLHWIWHATVPPHSIVQPALPWHSAVQPPFGQLIVQLLLPVHPIVEPVSSVTLHALPPPQLTVLLVPVDNVHVLVPVQLEVQFEPQLPTQFDWPAQLLVHPVPQVRLQVFFVWQSNVTLSGGAVPVPPSPPSTVAPVVAPPRVQTPPVLHVHVAPLQSQSPVQLGLGMLAPSLLPQPIAAMPVLMPSAPNETTSHERAR